MTDWATISSLATAGGTLVLAVATFASVRSANRSARLAEVALHEQLRPVLVHSSLEDPVQKIMFADGHWVRAHGSGAVVEADGDILYLALSLRNVGSGIGVLQAWYPWGELQFSPGGHAPIEQFRPLTRDLYIPPGGIGLWQGALRDPSEELHAELAAASAARRPFAVDLLYSDHMGAQRTVSRFSITPAGEDDRWVGQVGRHWHLDRPGPRRSGSGSSANRAAPQAG